MLNPAWLNTFKTLIDTGHFTKTAEKLFMTQPGVSQHVQKLELACGHALLKRDKKRFELTEQGRQVYRYAKQVEESEAQLLDNLNFDNPYAGHCHLSCSGSLALRLYPPLLELQREHPELVIQMEVAPNQGVLAGIQSGAIDIGIVTHIPNPDVFVSEQIGSEPLCLVVPAMFDKDGPTFSSLTSLGLIRHPDAGHYLSLYISRCGEPELEKLNVENVPTAGYVNQLSQILLPVSKGLGFTVLPQSAVESFTIRDNIRVLETQRQVNESLYLVKKRHRDLPKRFGAVITELKRQLSRE